jgi:hypothetical protein
MRAFILSTVIVLSAQLCQAQSQVNSLPAGKYETVIIKSNQDKWERGDIILLDDNKYRMSTSNETGEYRFSVTAQRIFFTSGPLRSMFAKTALNDNTPTIVIPVAENEQLGMKLPSEIRGYYKQ